MSKLVPTPITDKNGISTTRWKRPVSTPTGAYSLPAPPVPVSSTERLDDATTASEDEAFNLSVGLRAMMHKEKAPERVWNLFENETHPDTMDILEARYKDDYLRILPFMQRCIREESVASLNNAALFMDMMEHFGAEEKEQEDKYHRALFGLQWQHGAKHIDFSKDENNTESGRALVYAASRLGPPYLMTYRNAGTFTEYIPSKPLVELISRRTEDVDAIINILRDRKLSGFDDISTIEAILDCTEVDSLSSGVL